LGVVEQTLFNRVKAVRLPEQPPPKITTSRGVGRQLRKTG